VKGGVVTLSGTVDTYAQKFAAERAAERVAGVRAIAEELAVVATGEYNRSDADIARAAATAIVWDVEVPTDRVQVVVQHGWVTLEGNVEWFYQKAAAERAVRYLTGVKGVTNMIAVLPAPVKASDVKAKIEAALKRSAEIDADKIHVDTHDGSVTLSGSVRTRAEREDAERAAWSAPGVKFVKDDLKLPI
jgi:osmotically-inducible protein OsmY